MSLAAEMGVVRRVEGDVVPTRVEEDIVAIKMWQAEHDGRINALWEAQERFNDKCEAERAVLGRRVTSIEKRVLLLAFGGAIIGTVLGQQLPFDKLFGG